MDVVIDTSALIAVIVGNYIAKWLSTMRRALPFVMRLFHAPASAQHPLKRL